MIDYELLFIGLAFILFSAWLIKGAIVDMIVEKKPCGLVRFAHRRISELKTKNDLLRDVIGRIGHLPNKSATVDFHLTQLAQNMDTIAFYEALLNFLEAVGFTTVEAAP